MMSSCPKCSSHQFELVQVEPRGSAVKMFFAQCASCGCVVGTVEYLSTSIMLEKQGKSLADISGVVSSLSATVHNVQHMVAEQERVLKRIEAATRAATT